KSRSTNEGLNRRRAIPVARLFSWRVIIGSVESASWFEEMKRRRVFRALIGYGIVAFAVLQIIEPVMHGLALPEWVLSATVVGLGLGFPFALVLAWAFDVKGGRIERAGAPRGRLLVALGGAG